MYHMSSSSHRQSYRSGSGTGAAVVPVATPVIAAPTAAFMAPAVIATPALHSTVRRRNLSDISRHKSSVAV